MTREQQCQAKNVTNVWFLSYNDILKVFLRIVGQQRSSKEKSVKVRKKPSEIGEPCEVMDRR